MHLFFLDRYEKTVRATVLFTPLLQQLSYDLLNLFHTHQSYNIWLYYSRNWKIIGTIKLCNHSKY